MSWCKVIIISYDLCLSANTLICSLTQYFGVHILWDVLKIISVWDCGMYKRPVNRHKSLCKFIQFFPSQVTCYLMAKDDGNSVCDFFSDFLLQVAWITSQSVMNETYLRWICRMCFVMPTLDSLDIDFIHKIHTFTSLSFNNDGPFGWDEENNTFF